METILVVTETHPSDAGDAQSVIQQAVTDWLTKELYK